MDDEQPPPTQLTLDDDDAQSSGDEEGGLDWANLPGIARPVIPKRGEKDFEPKPGGGSGLQIHVLDSARSAMFDTLRATRTISNKTVSYAVWYPSIGRTHVTSAKGIHFTAMGHSAPRPVVDENGVEKIQKRLELLPEETIYLVERGSLFCWKDNDIAKTLSEMSGAPMTVQQVYAEMLGVEDLTLERLQVYTYLKRLGYSVMRTNPPTPYYPIPSPWPSQKLQVVTATSSQYILRRMFSSFSLWITNIFSKPFNWWRPLHISRWLYQNQNYACVFRSLRFMLSGHKVALHNPDLAKRLEKKTSSPYQVFYNIYKPSTPFKRSAPPVPDFQVVVINARTTPMPTLQELTDLFDVLPELPPPLPRIRRPLSISTATPPPTSVVTANIPVSLSSKPSSSPAAIITKPSLIQRLFPWAFPSTQPTGPIRRPHPFMALKAGKKLIVIAVVDAGSISFFRFGQGEFTEWPMA
ncbi:putative tRNA-splicing endonuclease subunit sen54 [Termitomyces sp. T112]|nr:putative tRNA-splicing endonuclease subunit sen54 [Termitomyces sp. T112]